MAHAIEVAGLTKSFGPVKAVDDLSFTVDEGRVTIEIGIAAVKPAEFVVIRIGQWAGPGSE